MLVESPRRLILLTSNQERPLDLSVGEENTDRDQGPRPVSWWDKVAERWPNGGRFPSLVFIDQSA
jgi:hypothetical protein